MHRNTLTRKIKDLKIRASLAALPGQLGLAGAPGDPGRGSP